MTPALDSMTRFLGLLRPLNQSMVKYQYFHQKKSRKWTNMLRKRVRNARRSRKLVGDPGNLSGAPRNVCRKGLKLPDIPGNLNWWNCNIILMTINEAYLFALSTTVTLTYIPVMTPGLLDTFLGASWDISWAYWIVSWTIFSWEPALWTVLERVTTRRSQKNHCHFHL